VVRIRPDGRTVYLVEEARTWYRWSEPDAADAANPDATAAFVRRPLPPVPPRTPR
jgi:hypothetical protein